MQGSENNVLRRTSKLGHRREQESWGSASRCVAQSTNARFVRGGGDASHCGRQNVGARSCDADQGEQTGRSACI